jgi:hypothetical protein
MGKERENAWEKAAACEAQAKGAKDPVVQAKFRALRDSWIKLGNNAQFETDVAGNTERRESEENSRGRAG